jgi:thiamine-monophosphate kinase
MATGSELSITTTVVGDAPDAPLTRSGVRPGDALFVTGTLGAASLGLQLLRAGRGELAPACVERWRRLVARVREGAQLAGTASAAIDVSDGLLQDLGHLASASGVGFELELSQLPLAPGLELACRVLGLDPQALALAGGEDYELLFTLPDGRIPPLGTRIGRAVAAQGVRLLDRQGRVVAPPPNAGFQHFTRR